MRKVEASGFAIEARVVVNMGAKQAELRQCRAQATTVDLAEVGRREVGHCSIQQMTLKRPAARRSRNSFRALDNLKAHALDYQMLRRITY